MKPLFLLAALGLALSTIPAQAALELKSSGAQRNFLFEVDSKALVTSVSLVFRSGSLSDPKGKEGLASLSFKAMLRGPAGVERREFTAELERLGAAMEVDIGSNRTILTINVLTENLEAALGLLAKTVTSPALQESEVLSLRQEELAGIHQELSANRNVARRVYRQALFGGTPLAFPPNGTSTGLQAISTEDIRSFLQAHVRSGQVVAGSVSNLPEARVRRAIEAAFTTLADGQAPAAPKLSLPEPKGRRLFLVERPGSSTTEVVIGHSGITAGNPDRLTLELGQFIFGGDMSSRLFTELRAKKGWTYGASSGFNFLEQPRRHGGSFQLYTFPQAEHTRETVLAALELYEDFVKRGVTSQELAFAQSSLANKYPFQFATSRNRLVGRLYQFLDGAPLLSVPQYQKFVRGLNRGKVLAAVKKFHGPANVAIVLVGDPKTLGELRAALPEGEKATVVADPQAPL